MYKFPIGVILESFRCERSEAIKKAAALGANGIQMYATKGANSAENLTATDRKELLKEVKDNGLVFSALCGDLGEGLFRPERNPQLIERSKRIIDLAKDLETNIVTTHIGVVPEDPNHDRYKIMQEACFELSRYADSLNAHFAIEKTAKDNVTRTEISRLNDEESIIELARILGGVEITEAVLHNAKEMKILAKGLKTE